MIKLIIPALLFPILVNGQQLVDASADTSKAIQKFIKLDEISIKSGEAIIQANKLIEKAVTDEQIDVLKKNNDSIINMIGELLNIDKAVDFRALTTRQLYNKQAFWYQYLNMLEREKTYLSSTIQSLEKKKFQMDDEIAVWNNTKEMLENQQPESPVILRVDFLLTFMDSIRGIMQQKDDRLLLLLDRNTIKSIQVDELIDLAESIIQSKKGEIFVKYRDPLFSIRFTDKNNWKVSEPLQLFYKDEVIPLMDYLKHHTNNIIFQIILLMLLVFLFRFVRRKILGSKNLEEKEYLINLSRLLSHTYSAALVLGLFASILIFPNRTELFIDITKLIVTIPLVILLVKMIGNKYRIYPYLFLLLVYLNTGSVILPPNQLFYRADLIAVAILEFVVALLLIKSLYKYPTQYKNIQKLILLFLYFFIVFSIVGLYGVISGRTMLAEISLNVPVVNTFAGILLILSSLIINGLVELLIESNYMKQLNIIRLYGDFLKRRIVSLIRLGALIFWIKIFMGSINLDKILFNSILNFFTNEINLGSVSFTLGNIITFFFVIWLSVIIARVLHIILEKEVLNRVKLSKGLPHTIALLVRYSLITAGIILAISIAGLPLTSLTILFGAFGVGIGFGLQNIFNNLVSGLILLFERPIQINDTIEVGQLIGKVKSIGIRSSKVRTFEGAEVIVPNGQLISNEVINWTLSDQQRRIEIIVGVAYGSDPHKAHDVILKTFEDIEDIIMYPPPRVLFNEMADSSLEFRVLFWTGNIEDWLSIRSDAVFRIFDALKENKIEIPFPQRDLHIRSMDKGISFSDKK